MARSAQRVELGVVSGAHGVRGAVRIRPFTDRPEAVAAYGPLSDEAGTRAFTLNVQRVEKGQVIARIDGIGEREAAEALKGTRLFVDRAALPDDPDPDSFYRHDLIGLEAVDAGGAVLGTVTALENFGAGDLLEISFPGRTGTDFVPFTRAFVPRVDVAAGRITLELPEDFFAAGKDSDHG